MKATAGKRSAILGLAVLSLGLIPVSAHADVVYIANGQPGFSDSGDWSPFTTNGYLGGSIVYDGTSATWTPTALSGDYTVQVYYYAGPTRPTSATYTVETSTGPVNVTINQIERANQGAATNQIVDENATYSSGWYTLGTFNLSPSGPNAANVVLTSSGGATANGVRFSNQDQIIDPLSASAVYNNFGSISDGVTGIWPTAGNPNEQPAYVKTGAANTTASLTYTPGLAGSRAVSISWVAGTDYTNAAKVLVDLDGNPATTGDITTINLDETLLANGSAPGLNDTWSGWDSLGTLNLTAASTFTYEFANGTPSEALSIGSLLIGNPTTAPIPEPASLGLLSIGGLALLRQHTRRA